MIDEPLPIMSRYAAADELRTLALRSSPELLASLLDILRLQQRVPEPQPALRLVPAPSPDGRPPPQIRPTRRSPRPGA